MLSVQGVHRWLGDRHGRRHVLRGVDLDVDRGQIVVVMGPSGSGKTTLLRCINHLEPVDAGEVLLNGELIGYERRNGVLYEQSDRDVAAMRRQIGMVFQQVNLFDHMTALRNVAFGPRRVLGHSKDDAQKTAIATLARVGLEGVADVYPSRLSGGQQQRVGIARALAMEPELILFDEPTSALDPELVGEVLEVMRTLAGQGRTMIVVTHELDFARVVGDTAVMLDHGVIVERGRCADVLGSPQHPRTRSFLRQVDRRVDRGDNDERQVLGEAPRHGAPGGDRPPMARRRPGPPSTPVEQP